MRVSCDREDCTHYVDGDCNAYYISIEDGECMDYEELPEEILHPDIYFIRNKIPNMVNVFEWEKKRGKKIEVLGREMFESYGRITDGRTGRLVGYKEYITKLEENKESVLNAILKAEKEQGISPLYEGK